MAEAAGVPRFKSDFVLEAGSLEGDGEGTILTTESCLLNSNRLRPGQDRGRDTMESLLSELLGAQCVLWLGDGIEGDDTDGHIDDLTRFIAPGRVVTIVEPDSADCNHLPLTGNLRRLEGFRDAKQRRLEIVELPTPGRIEGPAGRLPASYANFYIANQVVLIPVFGVEADREALAILEACFPERTIVPIPSRALVEGLGAVHCLTQQEPALPVLPHLQEGDGDGDVDSGVF
jgi:agmatine deiminase